MDKEEKWIILIPSDRHNHRRGPYNNYRNKYKCLIKTEKLRFSEPGFSTQSQGNSAAKQSSINKQKMALWRLTTAIPLWVWVIQHNCKWKCNVFFWVTVLKKNTGEVQIWKLDEEWTGGESWLLSWQTDEIFSLLLFLFYFYLF